MKLPRDLSGRELAKMLEPYGYRVTRQAGSHLRLTCFSRGKEHHITIPAHAGILGDIAGYLELDRQDLVRKLFGG